MTDVSDITRLIETQGVAMQEWTTAQSTRIKNLESEVLELAKKAGRPFASAATDSIQPHRDHFIDAKSGKPIPVFAHGDKLASLEQKSTGAPSIGRLLRGIIVGGQARDAQELAEERKSMNIFDDPSGGYTVSGALSNEWIDALRANMVLSKAGARTLPMETGQVSIARVTGDPTISWHGESASLSDTAPTFGKVTLDAKTVVCLCKLSLELAQDSQNIEQILQTTITQAMAGAIDSAGLNGSDTGQAGAPGGIFNASGINAISTVGAPTSWNFLLDGIAELLYDNVPLENVGAFIAHPKVWAKMSKLKTGISSDLTTLIPPPEIARLPKLYTSAAPYTSGTTCSGIVGDWRDLIFGVRKEITVRVLSETFMGSNLQVAVLAYARVDFAPTRATSFCVMPGITI